MGWLSMPLSSMGGHRTAKAYLDAQLTYERTEADGSVTGLDVLASSCVQNRVYYAACRKRQAPGDEVVAIVCLVRWNPRAKDGYVFAYKDMDETMGPCETGCPENILKLLTPTDHEYALDWRRRCLATLQRRARKLEHGARIKLASALTFTDGHDGDEFIVERSGRRLAFRDPASRRLYRIRNVREMAWSVVPELKVHATVFA